MRTIKFRGRSVYLDDYVYGYPIPGFGGKWWIYPAPDEPNEPVYTGTIEQLVGYDKNGNEVYEGDTVVNVHGYEFVVDYRDNPEFIRLHTLKETVA